MAARAIIGRIVRYLVAVCALGTTTVTLLAVLMLTWLAAAIYAAWRAFDREIDA